ncbi:MAG: helix-turn-helix domain-containing protein [Pseudomonadota bacterium]
MRGELQTLRRGFQALAIINAEGPVTVTGLAGRLDLPRANAHRIMSTLVSEGCCRKIPNSHLFVSTLSRQDPLARPSLTNALIASSIDILETLGLQIKWPLALSTPVGPTMVTRIATHLSTPLALERIVPGDVASMFDASTGIVFLALADARTRGEALSAARLAFPAEARAWGVSLDPLLTDVRQQGHFILARRGAEASLAVPVRLDGRPVGGIAMRYIKSAASQASVVERFLPRLREAAAAIEAETAQRLR